MGSAKVLAKKIKSIGRKLPFGIQAGSLRTLIRRVLFGSHIFSKHTYASLNVSFSKVSSQIIKVSMSSKFPAKHFEAKRLPKSLNK